MQIKPKPGVDPEGEPTAINKRLAIRCHDLQHELQTLQHTHKMLTLDLWRIAEALEVKPEGIGADIGIAPQTIIERIKELKEGQK